MFGNFFDVVVQAVKEWIPKREYATEGKYEDDLIRFLRERLKPSDGVGSYILGYGSFEQHVVRKGALLDIEIDDKIGIELKLNLEYKTERNRLVGQVMDFLSEHSYVLVILCGNVEQESLDVLKRDFSKLPRPSSSLLSAYDKVVKVISKEKSQIPKKEKNPFALF